VRWRLVIALFPLLAQLLFADVSLEALQPIRVLAPHLFLGISVVKRRGSRHAQKLEQHARRYRRVLFIVVILARARR
jgi:hypothetical protein